MSIQCKTVSKDFVFNITESIVTSEAETQDLELYLTSQGRSNQDTSREVWEYNTIRASFTGMNWVTNGWVVKCLFFLSFFACRVFASVEEVGP